MKNGSKSLRYLQQIGEHQLRFMRFVRIVASPHGRLHALAQQGPNKPDQGAVQRQQLLVLRQVQGDNDENQRSARGGGEEGERADGGGGGSEGGA